MNEPYSISYLNAKYQATGRPICTSRSHLTHDLLFVGWLE